MDWPTGGARFLLNNGRIVGDPLPPDEPVQIWVCCRVDQPWTWRLMPNQHIERCRDCGSAIVVAVTPRSPTNPDVIKLCRGCAVKLSCQDETR